MCDPTAIAIGSLILGVGSAAEGYIGNKNAADANKAAALNTMTQNAHDISLEQVQQKSATEQTIQQADRSARATQALARVSAGEAGVGGISVEAILGDIDRKLGEFSTTEGRNLDMALSQLEREKISGRTVASARIAAVPQPNPFALATTIAAQGLTFWAGQLARSATPSTPASKNP